MAGNSQRKPIRMDLRENAYDFLNESLRAAEEAESRLHAWKFAVLHVVQAIELLLKARLQAEHPVLIYENIDRRGNTVSLSQAVERITAAARIDLTPREQRALRTAQKWRDPIVHFEFEMNEYEVKSVYVQLFEFLMRFHDEHTDFGALHDHIDPTLWAKEAELIEFFRREQVVYRGVEVFREWPAEIIRAQEQTMIELHGRMFQRFRRGEEPYNDVRENTAYSCHDCAVLAGEYHVFHCDMEACPRCFAQLISCGCAWDEGSADAELMTREEYVADLRARYPEEHPSTAG
jgi:HEPN domain-containing protein